MASSTRAAIRPNHRWRGPRFPIMLSRVLIALQAKRPGRPSSTYQKIGATTASAKFSATDSIAARATPGPSRCSGLRPTTCETAARASAMPARIARATAWTWSYSPLNAMRVLATTASTSPPTGTRMASAWSSAPAPAAASVTPIATAPPLASRCASDAPSTLKRRSRPVDGAAQRRDGMRHPSVQRARVAREGVHRERGKCEEERIECRHGFSVRPHRARGAGGSYPDAHPRAHQIGASGP